MDPALVTEHFLCEIVTISLVIFPCHSGKKKNLFSTFHTPCPINIFHRRQGKVYHLRIRRPTRSGSDGKPMKMYQLESDVYFDSLYSLVIHYKTNPLKSPV